MTCPCGSKKSYEDCCGPYLEGKKDAPTPEALMRSRYTAFSKGDLSYIKKTMRKEALKRFNRETAAEQLKEIEYLKLDVLLSREEGNQGTVQFIVTFRFQGDEHLMSEISSFEKIKGKWYYTKGIQG